MEHIVPTEGATLSGARLMLKRDRERTELWRDLLVNRRRRGTAAICCPNSQAKGQRRELFC